MKSVLISIRPKWVEKIVKCEKTIEVRKSRPKIETPFKCYIYCSYGNGRENYMLGIRGKVIGEFICNNIDDFSEWEYDYPSLFRSINLYAGTNGDYAFLNDYLKGKKKGYGWHISELKIYDKPKELREYKKPCFYKSCIRGFCEHWKYSRCENFLTIPPQSWCYMEE